MEVHNINFMCPYFCFRNKYSLNKNTSVPPFSIFILFLISERTKLKVLNIGSTDTAEAVAYRICFSFNEVGNMY